MPSFNCCSFRWLFCILGSGGCFFLRQFGLRNTALQKFNNAKSNRLKEKGEEIDFRFFHSSLDWEVSSFNWFLSCCFFFILVNHQTNNSLPLYGDSNCLSFVIVGELENGCWIILSLESRRVRQLLLLLSCWTFASWRAHIFRPLIGRHPLECSLVFGREYFRPPPDGKIINLIFNEMAIIALAHTPFQRKLTSFRFVPSFDRFIQIKIPICFLLLWLK